MTDPAPSPPGGEPLLHQSAKVDGFTIRYAWPVWSNQVQHRAEVALNLMTSSARISVDGDEVARRGPWHMNVSGFEMPFDVDGRSCLLVVRHRYGDQPEVDLYSDGRSLTTGAPLAERRKTYRTEIPNVTRFLLIFLPIFGVPSAIRSFFSMENAPPAWVWIVVIGAGVGLALAGWWAASRWYGRTPEKQNRHVVGGGIVAVTWFAFFAIWFATIAATR